MPARITVHGNAILLMPEPVFVDLLRSPGIDFQGRPVRQPCLSYRIARLHRLAESIPRNRFLGSINVCKIRALVFQSFVGELGINLTNFDLISSSVLNKTSMSSGLLEKVKTHEARRISKEEKKLFTSSLNICLYPNFPGDHVDISFKDDVTVNLLGILWRCHYLPFVSYFWRRHSMIQTNPSPIFLFHFHLVRTNILSSIEAGGHKELSSILSDHLVALV